MYKSQTLRILSLKLKTNGNENSGYIVNWYKDIPTKHKLSPDIFMHFDEYSDPDDPEDLIDEDGSIFIAGSYLDPGINTIFYCCLWLKVNEKTNAFYCRFNLEYNLT